MIGPAKLIINTPHGKFEYRFGKPDGSAARAWHDGRPLAEFSIDWERREWGRCYERMTFIGRYADGAKEKFWFQTPLREIEAVTTGRPESSGPIQHPE